MGADTLSGMEWWTVIPVATVVSVAVTFFVRFLDTPRALLTLEAQYMRAGTFDPRPEVTQFDFLVTNSGDGHARDFLAVGHLCDLAIRLTPAAPGKTERFVQSLPTLAPGESVLVEGSMSTADRDEAMVVLTWNHRPGRPWSRMTRRILQAKAFEMRIVPFLPAGGYEGEALPRTWRRWRRLERHTERYRDPD